MTAAGTSFAYMDAMRVRSILIPAGIAFLTILYSVGPVWAAAAAAARPVPVTTTMGVVCGPLNLLPNFQITNSTGADLCVNAAFAKVVKAISFLENLPPLRSANDQFDQDIIGPSAIQFVRERIKAFDFVKPNVSVCRFNGPPAGVQNPPNTSGSVLICPDFADDEAFQLASILVHEARHLDAELYLHVKCSSDRFTSGYGCDESYNEKGSYAAGTEFEVKVSRCVGVPPATRQVARDLAISDFAIRFNNPPFKIKRVVGIQAKDGRIYINDGVNADEFLTQVPPKSIVWTDSFSISILDYEANTFAQKNIYGAYVPIPDSVLKDHDNFQGLADVTRFTVFKLSQGEAYPEIFETLISKDKIVFQVEDYRTLTLQIKTFVPNSVFTIDHKYYISSAAGELYEMPSQFFDQKEFKESQLKKVKTTARYLNVVDLGDGYIGLKPDGDLVKFQTLGGPVTRFPEAHDIKNIFGPIVWSDELKKL